MGRTGVERIRFYFFKSKDLTDETIAAIRKMHSPCLIFILQFKVDLQRVLKKDEPQLYEEWTWFLAFTHIQDCAFTAALSLAGFPGETEEDFEDTLSLVREAGYSPVYLHLL